MLKKIINYIALVIGIISGIMTIISFLWLVLDIEIRKLQIKIDLNLVYVNILILLIGFFSLMLISVIYLIKSKFTERMKMKIILMRYRDTIYEIKSWIVKKLDNNIEINEDDTIISTITSNMVYIFENVLNKKIELTVHIFPDDLHMRAIEHVICILYHTKFNQKFNNMHFNLDKWNRENKSVLEIPIFNIEENGNIDKIKGYIEFKSLKGDVLPLNMRKKIIPLLESISDFLFLVLNMKDIIEKNNLKLKISNK